MNTVKPPVDSHNGNRGDDVDGLLRDFFRAEMPSPWPELKLPSPARNGFHPKRSKPEDGPAILPLTPKKRPWAVVGPRVALAASVALLLLGSLFLSGQFKGNKPGESPLSAPGGQANPKIPRDLRNGTIKERIEVPVEEGKDHEGRSIRKEGPSKYVIDFFDQGF
jgi:hypothetical protein